jgi:hypothetical protein
MRDASAPEGTLGPDAPDLDTGRADAAATLPGVPSTGTTGDTSEANTSDANTSEVDTSEVDTSEVDTSDADPSNTTQGMSDPVAESFADSGARDASLESSTSAVVDAGAPENDASVSEVPTLRLDPETLSFFMLPIGSVRFAVGGFSAEHGLCASIIWWDERTRCGDLGESRVYVVLSEADAPPCEAWDYQPNVETTRAEGCVDVPPLGENGLVEVGLVDVELDVSGELFSGRIIADNRSTFSPARVSLGLTVTSAAPVTLYVPRGDTQGSPGWVQGYRDLQAVNFFDRQSVPNCDGSEPGDAVGSDQVFMDHATTGAVFTTWDGNLYVEVQDAQTGGLCETPEPAPPGEYSVELCFGASVLDDDSGNSVLDVVCVTEPFELPTESVFAQAQYP